MLTTFVCPCQLEIRHDLQLFYFLRSLTNQICHWILRQVKRINEPESFEASRGYEYWVVTMNVRDSPGAGKPRGTASETTHLDLEEAALAPAPHLFIDICIQRPLRSYFAIPFHDGSLPHRPPKEIDFNK